MKSTVINERTLKRNLRPPVQVLRGVDLYCGAGGMTTGAQKSGYIRIDLAVNHWRPAILTHSTNHPHTRHICAEMEHVDPLNDSTLPDCDVIMAGVECTHHSNAKGGAPVSDQKRSSARNVIDWVKAKSPLYLIIENVREFRDWGPTRLKLTADGKKIWDKKHRQWAREADPEHKGEYFHEWVKTLQALGYRVEHRLLNSADFGAATKRIRLFIIARRDAGAIAWPESSHSEAGVDKPKWRAAAEIIDWQRSIPSVFGRTRPLAAKTLARIKIGLVKFNAPKTISEAMQRSGMEPLIVTCSSGEYRGLVSPEPFIVKYHSGINPRHWQNCGASIDHPLPTIDTNPRFALAHPFSVQTQGPGVGDMRYHAVKSLTQPLPTFLSRINHGIAVPFVYQLIGRGAGRSYNAAEPLPTIVASRENFGVVEPYLFGVDHRSGNGSPRGTSSPVSTITSKQRHCLAIPFLVPNFGERDGQLPRSHSVWQPLPVVTSHGAGSVVQPFLLPRQGIFDAHQPGRCRSIYQPLNTITAHDTAAHLVIPYLIDVNHGESNRSPGGRVHSVDFPLGTITGKRTKAIIEPTDALVVNYYGTGIAHRATEPLSTVTTKHRHGLTLFGDAPASKKIITLNADEASLFWAMKLLGFDDILFRMLDVDELARAMGLSDDYVIHGNKAEQIKQVGNMVNVETMQAICGALGEYELELAEAA
jgi:DNA (cytosine-5)-methyltransferase 1